MVNSWLARYNLYFAQEYFLILLLLIPIVFLLLKKWKVKPAQHHWSYSAPILKDSKWHSSKNWMTKAPTIMSSLRWASILCLIIALARPQLTNTVIHKTQEGIDIMLALDVSASMFAEDFSPNRLEAAKVISENFIEKRYGDRIGLVIFSGESFSQCPLTLDHRVLIELLKRANGQFLESGTNIGNGIASSINGLKGSKGTSKIVILLTDGYEEVNTKLHISPELAVEMANEFGVKVYTIGVGTQGQAMVPISANGRVYKELREVKIDEETLMMIAEKTGAQYYRATDNASLEQIYQEINALEKSTAEYKAFVEYKDILHIFILIAFVTILIEIFLRYVTFRSITE